jgi:hypothetical protein
MQRPTQLFAVLTTAFTLVVAACSADQISSTGAPSASPTSANFSATVTSPANFTLSSVTPPIECTDASGAVTTVTGGTLALGSAGKFTATFTTSTTTGEAVTTQTYSEKGSFTHSGSTLVFKVPGAGTYTGTLDSGTLTIADYPFCGATHTAIFTQA